MTDHRALLRPDRLRTVEHPFGWAPCRMLNNGTIASMSPLERQLYLVLVLAADRRGISFHGDQRIQRSLGCAQQELCQARTTLMERDLLAYDGRIYQLLPLPPDVARTAGTAKTARKSVQPSQRNQNRRQRQEMPESVRETLRKLFGGESF